jgi:glycine cleavage system H protein
VTARNDQLDSSPELLNTDPYGDGWMVDLRPAGGLDTALASPALLDAAAYGELTAG